MKTFFAFSLCLIVTISCSKDKEITYNDLIGSWEFSSSRRDGKAPEWDFPSKMIFVNEGTMYLDSYQIPYYYSNNTLMINGNRTYKISLDGAFLTLEPIMTEYASNLARYRRKTIN